MVLFRFLMLTAGVRELFLYLVAEYVLLWRSDTHCQSDRFALFRRISFLQTSLYIHK